MDRLSLTEMLDEEKGSRLPFALGHMEDPPSIRFPEFTFPKGKTLKYRG